MGQLFKNNARSTLAASLASGGMSLTIEALDAAKFPAPTGGDYFDLTLQDATNIEIVRVTARSADVLTISARALEGTTSPTTFAIGTVVGIRLTAAVVESTLAHVSDTDAAHAASAIANTPSGNLAATNVQTALNELQTDVDSRATSAALTAHAAAADPHPGYTTTAELTAGLATKAASSHTHTLSEVTDAGTAAAANVGTASGNVPVVGTASDTETVAGLSRRNTTAEAEAGTLDAGHMTPLKTAQAIAALAVADGAFQSMQVFTSSGTYTKPAGLRRIKVTVTGGGNSGRASTAYSGPAAGGGGGGTAIKVIEAASLGATENYTVGGVGGASSFGTVAFLSATGGGYPPSYGVGGVGGSGSGGDVNLSGESGGKPNGGASHLAPGRFNSSAGIFPGGGGTGGNNGGNDDASSEAGYSGSAGIVIVEEFF